MPQCVPVDLSFKYPTAFTVCTWGRNGLPSVLALFRKVFLHQWYRATDMTNTKAHDTFSPLGGIRVTFVNAEMTQ